MVDGLAAAVVPTGTYAGVRALLLDARFVAWTLGIDDTFRSAVWCGAYVTWQTRAGLVTIDFSAERIRSTGVRHTGNLWSLNWWWFRLPRAAKEWITNVAVGAAADGVVVDNLTFSVSTACSGAGVSTLLLDAGLAQLALGGEEALWPAVGGTSEVAWQTGAHWTGACRAAVAVGPTGVRVAGVTGLLNHRLSCR